LAYLEHPCRFPSLPLQRVGSRVPHALSHFAPLAPSAPRSSYLRVEIVWSYLLAPISVPVSQKEEMPILSRRNAPKLLRSVNNQPHASPEDHEDDARARQTNNSQMKHDVDVHADPISSSDEIEAPPPPSMSQSSNTSTRNNSRSTTRASNGAPRKQSVRRPKTGTFTKGRAHKDRFGEEDKENEQGPSSSSGKRETGETVYFGMGDTPKRNKRTKNVHVAPVVGFNKKSFQKDKTDKRGWISLPWFGRTC